jgi:hypothetical protein
MTQNTVPVTPAQPVVPAPRRPNDTGSVSVEAHVRIRDPKTGEIFVEKRA